MAIGSPIVAAENCRPTNTNELTTPVSISSDWMTAIDIGGAILTDNSGNSIINPGAIAAETRHWIQTNRRGTTLQVRLVYDDGTAPSTDPVIQVFGRDKNNEPQKLLDSAGAHELTLTTVTGVDVTDGTDEYTSPVELDMDGNAEVIVLIKTAFDTGDGDDALAYIQVRIK